MSNFKVLDLLRTLEIFHCAAQLGSFSRAAAKLNTSQPAVTARIGNLEKSYNIELFHRIKGQKPELTPRGQELYGLTERMLALGQDIELVLNGSDVFRGRIRIGVSETVVHTWLPCFLRGLHERYPDLSPEVSVDVSVVLRQGLMAGELDLAILLGPLNLPRVREVPLCSYELVWAAKPGLAVPAGLVDLQATPILTFARATPPTQAIVDAFGKAGLPLPRLYPNSSLSAVVRMALDGIGVCVAPRVVIADELDKGKLQLLDIPVAVPPLDYVAAYVEAPNSSRLAAVTAVAQACAGYKECL
jgi:DNA-binding transcriptional LysR family regulator